MKARLGWIVRKEVEEECSIYMDVPPISKTWMLRRSIRGNSCI
jgi:hypothetical protein